MLHQKAPMSEIDAALDDALLAMLHALEELVSHKFELSARMQAVSVLRCSAATLSPQSFCCAGLFEPRLDALNAGLLESKPSFVPTCNDAEYNRGANGGEWLQHAS
jgi:hypothetical protein